MKRKFIDFQQDNFLILINKKMTTIAQRAKNNKRSRPIELQPEDIIYQNQDQESNLTPQQKGRLFEEQCQELI